MRHVHQECAVGSCLRGSDGKCLFEASPSNGSNPLMLVCLLRRLFPFRSCPYFVEVVILAFLGPL